MRLWHGRPAEPDCPLPHGVRRRTGTSLRGMWAHGSTAPSEWHEIQAPAMNELQRAQDLAAAASVLAKDLGCTCDVQVIVAVSPLTGRQRVTAVHEHRCSLPEDEKATS